MIPLLNAVFWSPCPSGLSGPNLIQRVIYCSRSEALSDIILTEDLQVKPEYGINYPATYTYRWFLQSKVKIEDKAAGRAQVVPIQWVNKELILYQPGLFRAAGYFLFICLENAIFKQWDIRKTSLYRIWKHI